MNRTQKKIKEIRAEQYSYISELYPYINDWKKNPYTFLKARFYMESSAVLVYFLLKTKIKPNTVTIFYGCAGIVTGILLAIPNNYTIFNALLIAFTKGILDWSDGHLARVTGRTSLTGHILDGYGAVLNSLGLQIGLGLYVAVRMDLILFYYLVPLLLFFRAAGLFSYSRYVMFEKLSDTNIISNYKKKNESSKGKKIHVKNSGSLARSKYAHYLGAFLDDRARSVDFICLIILLEIFFPINISWLLFLLIVAKYFIIFTGTFYIVAKGGWAENKIMNKIKELHHLLDKDKNET